MTTLIATLTSAATTSARTRHSIAVCAHDTRARVHDALELAPDERDLLVFPAHDLLRAALLALALRLGQQQLFAQPSRLALQQRLAELGLLERLGRFLQCTTQLFRVRLCVSELFRESRAARCVLHMSLLCFVLSAAGRSAQLIQLSFERAHVLLQLGSCCVPVLGLGFLCVLRSLQQRSVAAALLVQTLRERVDSAQRALGLSLPRLRLLCESLVRVAERAAALRALAQLLARALELGLPELTLAVAAGELGAHRPALLRESVELQLFRQQRLLRVCNLLLETLDLRRAAAEERHAPRELCCRLLEALCECVNCVAQLRVRGFCGCELRAQTAQLARNLELQTLLLLLVSLLVVMCGERVECIVIIESAGCVASVVRVRVQGIVTSGDIWCLVVAERARIAIVELRLRSHTQTRRRV